MPERAWKLGDDLCDDDNLMDGITFGDVIRAVRCNAKVIDESAVKREVKNFIEMRFGDLYDLLRLNMKEIVEEAKKGRDQDDIE